MKFGHVCSSLQISRPWRWAILYLSCSAGLSLAQDTSWIEVTIPATAPAQALITSPARRGFLLRRDEQGLWHSVDDGQSWQRRTSLVQAGRGGLTADAADPLRVALCDDLFLCRSADAGLSFACTDPTSDPNDGALVARYDPKRPGRLLLLLDRLFHASFAESFDHGSSWSVNATNFLIGPELPFQFEVVDPSGTLLFANPHGLHRSTDGGANWSTVLTVGVDAIASSAATPGLVWIGGDGLLLRSLDDGQSWSSVPPPSGAGRILGISAHPNDPAELLISTSASGIHRSSNGGASWSLSGGVPNAATALLARSQQNPRVVHAASTAGLGAWRSADLGQSFQPAVHGLSDRVRALSADSQAFGRVWVLSARTVQTSNDGGEHWRTLSGWPLSGFEIDALECSNRGARLLFSIDQVHRRLLWSDDGGKRWMARARVFATAIADLELSADDHLLVARDGQVSVSADGGQFWTDALAGSAPCRLSADPHNRSLLYQAASSGYYRSADGGLSWQRIGHGNPTFTNYADVAPDPQVVGVVYLLRREPARLFRSTDHGLSFTQVGAGLPAVEARRLAIDPVGRRRLLIGTAEAGVFLSSDAGQSFLPFSEGLADAGVLDLIFPDPTASTAWLVSDAGLAYRRDLP